MRRRPSKFLIAILLCSLLVQAFLLRTIPQGEKPIIVIFQFESETLTSSDLESIYKQVCDIISNSNTLALIPPDAIESENNEILSINHAVKRLETITSVAKHHQAEIAIIGTIRHFGENEYEAFLRFIPVNYAKYGFEISPDYIGVTTKVLLAPKIAKKIRDRVISLHVGALKEHNGIKWLIFGSAVIFPWLYYGLTVKPNMEKSEKLPPPPRFP